MNTRERELVFTAHVPFQELHPTALAVYCSDGRFTAAVEELLSHLGHARLDTMTIPGGPALFNIWSAPIIAADYQLKAASFLIQAHRINKVVLIAHESCGYYASQARLDPSAIYQEQIEDLHVAARALGSTSVEIDKFYAHKFEGGIQFRRVV